MVLRCNTMAPTPFDSTKHETFYKDWLSIVNKRIKLKLVMGQLIYSWGSKLEWTFPVFWGQSVENIEWVQLILIMNSVNGMINT